MQFPTSFLFRDTIQDNIAAGRPGASPKQVVEAAREAGAGEFIQKLEQGYATELKEGATNLSGGQKQRLAIARALLRQPRILILDEATSALDPESEAAVQENLHRIVRNRTAVMVSHRLSLIRNADAILVLDQGQIVGFGPHDRLVKECLPYKQLWECQSHAFQ